MWNRIAIVEPKDKMPDSIQERLDTRNAFIAPLAEAETAPPGTVAVVGEARRLDAMLNAACAIGLEQAGILQLLADAIDCREGIALGASERVRAHAARFAQALRLSADEQLVLERGALLRDIGKLKVPNEVLLKRSVLSYDEWLLLQAHSALGAELLLERGLAGDVIEIVHHHHECYDGDGYPDHLEKEAIPYLARVMKILDVYCAMTSPRHYRANQSSHKDAVTYLKSEQGKHFDPELIEVFIASEVGEAP